MKKGFLEKLGSYRKWLLFIGRYVLYAVIGMSVLLALILAVVHTWLPTLAEKREDIENYLAKKTSLNIEIGELSTYWDGIHPGLTMANIKILETRESVSGIEIPELRASLALLPLLHGSIELSNLIIVKPSISLRRMLDGRMELSGFAPMAMKKTGTPGALFLWLSKLGKITIDKGALRWIDDQSGGEEVFLSDIMLTMSISGDRNELSVAARYPESMCLSCYFSIDFEGDPFVPSEWSGRVYLHAVRLNTHNLPAILRKHIPPGTGGRFDLLLRSEFESGRPNMIQGYINTEDFSLSLPDAKLPIKANVGRAKINWVGGRDQWRLDLKEFSLGLQGPEWDAGHLRIERDREGIMLRLGQANLDDLMEFISVLPVENARLDQIKQLEPRGSLKHIKLKIEGELKAPRSFLVEADINNFDIRPYKKFPGFHNLAGTFSITKDSGKFLINSGVTKMELPHIFRWPLDARRITGSVKWRRNGGVWEIEGKKLQVFSDDFNGDARWKMVIPIDKTQSPSISLHAKYWEADIHQASKYYPINVMHGKLLKWMDKSIVSGRGVAGHVIVEGETRKFPFQHGGGTFEVLARVEDGVVDYLPGWPPLRQADATLLFRGSEMIITCREAKLRSLDVKRLLVYSGDLKTKNERMIHISGQVVGAVDTTLSILRDRYGKPGDKWAQLLDSQLHGRGDGELGLRIAIPPDSVKQTTIAGEYVIQGGSLKFPIANFRADNIIGNVKFDQSGIQLGAFRGNFLGGHAHLQMNRDPGEKGQSITRFEASGQLTAEGLADALGQWLRPYIGGKGKWEGSLSFVGDRPNLLLRADAHDFEVKLPEPMEKKSGVAMSFEAKTEFNEGEQHTIAVQFGNYLDGKFLFKRQSDKWLWWGGDLGLADAEAGVPRQQGLGLRFRSKYIDADAWYNAISRGGGNGIPDFIHRMAGQFGAVDVFDRKVGSLYIRLNRTGNDWAGVMHGDSIDGQITAFFGRPYNKFVLDLERLKIPSEKFRNSGQPLDPDSIPLLQVRSKEFNYGDMRLGALDLSSTHEPSGWRLSQLTLTRPEAKLFAEGLLSVSPTSDFAGFNIQLDVTDLGQYMDALGFPDQIAGGTAAVRADLLWKEASALTFDNMDGNVAISADHGRFTKIEQGVGKLLGIINLDALGRFLRLDFASVFGKGYVFDKLRGQVRIEKGDAYTRNLKIEGPTADMQLSGRVGFAKEDYNLLVGVNPSFADTLAMASWGLGAPQLGAVILVFKKLFKKQADKDAAITYTIKGPWDNPVVDRVSGETNKNGGVSQDAEEVVESEE